MRDYNKEYQDNERRYAYNFDGILRRYMMRTFQPLFLKGRALELGCFDGETTALILEHFDDVTVIEAAKDLVDQAHQRVNGEAKFIHSRFEDASPGAFENIFLVHTLEHLDDPVAVLRRIGSWLVEGGRFFVVVPNANAPSRQIAVKMGLISHNAAVTDAEAKHGHRATYSFDTLEREIKAAGLPILQRGGIFFKALANYQFDRLLQTDIISPEYLDGCYKLGMQYPELCASIYCVCGRP